MQLIDKSVVIDKSIGDLLVYFLNLLPSLILDVLTSNSQPLNHLFVVKSEEYHGDLDWLIIHLAPVDSKIGQVRDSRFELIFHK